MDDKGPQIIAVIALFLTLSWLMVGLRSFVRLGIKKYFGFDDVFALATLVVFTTLCCILLYGVHVGIGKHVTALTLENFSSGLRIYLICELLYTSSTGLIKISFCLSLLRIVVSRSHKYIIYVVMAMTTVFTTFYFFFILFTCRPVSFFWEQVKNPVGGSCRSPVIMTYATYAHGVVMCLGDMTLATLPIFLVWNLNMNRLTKCTVVVLLAFGSVPSIATIARIPYVHFLKDKADFLYSNSEIAIWSIVEVGISLIATSVATLRPLVAKYHIFSSNRSGNVGIYETGSSRRKTNATHEGNFAMGPMRSSNRKMKGSMASRGLSSIGMRGRSIGNTGSSEEIIWDGKGGVTTGEVTASDDMGTQNIGIQKVVEFSMSSSNRT
ncbi:hypothetical protein K432DRAFT_339104 [Lepidopterella palustris CBS 459.81]|uniref:Rhodopsin domain-containing protein n=1 Tax=Lepidopterella palustris CBS 459.81 TaxID=1314670 RepID=A0A8E2DZA8_9PEZI|nr:hypothetical protein K432DRAFT_339104 [Lepidopterella palustris CBS 459.81]